MSTRFFSTLLALAFASTPALADAHKWEITEVFSNADGTVQFIEWFTGDDDENLLTTESLSTSSGGFFRPATNLSSTATGGRNLLMATAAFAALPGAPAPDYILPDGFMNPNGDTINYTGGDVVSFGALPMDGTSSISRNGSPSQNSPRNFAGQSGSISLDTNVATADIRNLGGNRACYSADAPVLGTTWTGTVAGGPTANLIAIMGYQGASSGPNTSGGSLLVDLASPQIFVLVTPSAGLNTTLMNVVPADSSLLGFSLATQGVVIGGGAFELCNAVDLVLGN